MKAVAEKKNEQNGGVADRPCVSPEVNIFETPEGYMLEGEMPGVTKRGLEITLEGNTLTIVGHRNEADFATDPVYRESRAGSFRRVFELDPAIDTSKINAKMEQGVLKLHLPKAEKVKPRKIQVTD